MPSWGNRARAQEEDIQGLTQVVSVAAVPAHSTVLLPHAYLIRWTLALSRSARRRCRTKKSPPGGAQHPKPVEWTTADESKHSKTKSKKNRTSARKKDKNLRPTLQTVLVSMAQKMTHCRRCHPLPPTTRSNLRFSLHPSLASLHRSHLASDILTS